jgi:hypothetical protein
MMIALTLVVFGAVSGFATIAFFVLAWVSKTRDDLDEDKRIGESAPFSRGSRVRY